MSAKHQCPACGSVVSAAMCCGIRLASAFAMTATRIKALRRYAHGRKGLDQDTYRLHVQAVGASSTTELSGEQYLALVKRLGALPDRRRHKPGRAAA